MKRLVFLLTLAAITYTESQVGSSKFVNDFILNDENNPSTFLQEGTRLFTNDTKNLIYTWRDYRLGEPSYFAQKVDSNGNKVGDNFKVLADLDLCMAPNNSFLVLAQNHYTSVFPGWGDDYYNVEGKIYLDENNSYPSFYITGGILPWCGTGWLGLHHTLCRTDSHYIYFHSSGGPTSLHKYSFSGELAFQSNPDDSLPFNAFDIACAANKFNEFALFSAQFSFDNLNAGLYASFFSPNNSTISKNVLISALTNNYGSTASNYLRAKTIQDSIYLVFWASNDSLKIYSWKINRNGSRIISQTPLALLVSGLTGNNITKSISNMTLSPLNNGIFSLLVTVKEYRTSYKKDFNTLFNFNQQGDLINVVEDSTYTFDFGNYFFQASDHSLLVPASSNNDAYQKRLINLVVVDSLKLNDDDLGSNELDSKIHKINNNESFISYTDEVNSIGKKVDLNGNILTNEIILENRKLNFFSDGWSVAAWYEEEPLTYNVRVGISIYDQNFNLSRKIYLTTFQQLNKYIECMVMPDTNIVVSFFDNNNLYLRMYGRSGEMLNEKLIKSNISSYPISIFYENQNSFLVTTYRFTQMFNFQLEPTSPQFEFQSFYYLGNLRTLITSTDIYNKLYGQISLLNGDTLTNKFLLTNTTRDFSFVKLNDNHFAILYNIDNNIYVKSFSTDGNQIGQPHLIHSDVTGFRKEPFCIVNNNKVIFTWSDARNPFRGYDVYYSIFNLSDLTDVGGNSGLEIPSEFKLYQNYPNPFNPSTRISWQSPVGSWQTLKVYDVLGNEVATLVDEYKPAGSYEVEFLPNDRLASGVYFYQIIVGKFRETKKMMFLR